MKLVPVGDKWAKVDDDVYKEISRYNWYLNKNGYAITRVWNDEKRRYDDVFMHRVINSTPAGFVTDHINRDKLDNRRENLRTATEAMNAFNSKVRSDNTSGYTGISWRSTRNKWRAHITLNGKHVALGEFDELADALAARKRAEDNLVVTW